MTGVGRDDEYDARPKGVRHSFDDEIELSGKDADDLLVRMLMFGKRGAGVDLNP